MSTLFVPVGIPGCGKSTYARSLRSSGGCDLIVSTDDIRAQQTGNASDQTANDSVFFVAHNRVRAALTADLNVLFDATNIRIRDRAVLLAIAEECGAFPVALYFTDSDLFDVCQARNLARERVVSEDVMRRFQNTFVADCSPFHLADEGFKVVRIQ